jgi:hypothetical protein
MSAAMTMMIGRGIVTATKASDHCRPLLSFSYSLAVRRFGSPREISKRAARVGAAF